MFSNGQSVVAAIIFVLHGLLLVGAFVWKLRTGSFTDAALSVAFIIIIFSVGWTLSGLLTGLLFESQGLAEWMNRDTISLVLVTLGEAVFYTVFLRSLGDKPKEQAKA